MLHLAVFVLVDELFQQKKLKKDQLPRNRFRYIAAVYMDQISFKISCRLASYSSVVMRR